MFGELHWIFTAVTDTIALTSLPRTTFQRLFRQDLLLASLSRNYLLACRVLGEYGCTPVRFYASYYFDRSFPADMQCRHSANTGSSLVDCMGALS